MFPSGGDAAPEPVADTVYDRASVLRFLDDAEVARERLEAALVAAHQRRHEAELALRAAAEDSLRATAALHAATRDLAAERDTTESVVAVILEVAETEAQTIIADARVAAAAVLAQVAGAEGPGAEPHHLAPVDPDARAVSDAVEADARPWPDLQLVG